LKIILFDEIIKIIMDAWLVKIRMLKLFALLHNYFDNLKLFLDLYLVIFLDILAKLFFP